MPSPAPDRPLGELAIGTADGSPPAPTDPSDQLRQRSRAAHDATAFASSHPERYVPARCCPPLLRAMEEVVRVARHALRAQLATDGVAAAVRATAGDEFQRSGNRVLVLQRTLPEDSSGTRIRPTGGAG